MGRRAFWLLVGMVAGVIAVSKARAYVRANTPTPVSRVLAGKESDNTVVRTIVGLVEEFNATRQAREAELNRRYGGPNRSR